MMRNNQNSLGFLGWLGIIVLVVLFFFKWLPDWTWRPKEPSIEIYEKGFFLDHAATWQNETATITGESLNDIYIKIKPKEATEPRANLKVTLDNQTISSNCDYKADYFCYQIAKSTLKNSNAYEIIAKNDAGEKHATLKIVSGQAATKSQSGSANNNSSSTNSEADSNAGQSPNASPSPDSSQSSNSSSNSSTNSSSSSSSSSPTIKSISCLHYEAGRCWDDYESEMYSSGLYDKAYGYYGASYDYPDDCDSRCQDILDDAYDEGYYDNF